jgi:predicted transcriptional regulator
VENPSQPELVELTARIVSAYVSNNAIVASDLAHLISETHAALSRATGNSVQLEREEQKPKVPVKKSVMPDYIICLEDGKKFKSLKRHLRTHCNVARVPRKWGLPHDYPMVPNYARHARILRKMGSEPAARNEPSGLYHFCRRPARAAAILGRKTPRRPAPYLSRAAAARLAEMSGHLGPIGAQQLGMAGEVVRQCRPARAAARPSALRSLARRRRDRRLGTSSSLAQRQELGRSRAP